MDEEKARKLVAAELTNDEAVEFLSGINREDSIAVALMFAQQAVDGLRDSIEPLEEEVEDGHPVGLINKFYVGSMLLSATTKKMLACIVEERDLFEQVEDVARDLMVDRTEISISMVDPLDPQEN